MPEHTYLFKNKALKGFKSSKERVTVLCCANMKSEKRDLQWLEKVKILDVLKVSEVCLLIAKTGQLLKKDCSLELVYIYILFDILLTVYHYVSQQRPNLIHFHFHNHFIVSWSSTCFGRQKSIFRRHYTSGFWCELRVLLDFGWLQVLGRLGYWTFGCGCRFGGLVGSGLTVVTQLVHRVVFTAILFGNQLFVMVVGLNV
jgi:hypothetical protein